MSGRVVHCKREPFDVYIGRPSKWGNPFKIGEHGTREEVIEQYRDYIQDRADLMQALPELDGKVLGCWCSPEPCHGDVLLEMIAPIGRGGEWMNIDTGKIYPSREEALRDGVPEDKLVSGTKTAIEELKERLFPKSKRAKF